VFDLLTYTFLHICETVGSYTVLLRATRECCGGCKRDVWFYTICKSSAKKEKLR